MRTVLASVTDKSGLDNFLKRLERFDEIRLIATTSTAQFLTEKGFTCKKVEELTGFPEILSGRVKTLHPRVFAGILSRPSQEDRSALAELEISEIDIVIVNLYRFEDKLTAGLSEPQMIEQIDVGGVALLRAGAKNFERVAILSSPAQYERLIENLDANKGELTQEFRKQLAYEAFLRTSSYDRSISSYLEGQLGAIPENNKLPETINLKLDKHQSLRYGENPHQAANWYMPHSKGAGDHPFPPFEQLQGKEMSSNNITDTYALAKILRDISHPGACIIKHNNPCGVAIGKNIDEAFKIAYDCDPISAFGGVIGVTGKIGAELAASMTENFIEIVLAPDFDPEALDIFKKKKNVRVLKVKGKGLAAQKQQNIHLKDLEDYGVLAELEIEPPVAAADFRCLSKKPLDKDLMPDVAFAWAVVKHLTSNAIFIARQGRSIGFGIGQTSRIASMEIALEQAGKNAQGAVIASDAFFPATDNIEAAAKAGIAVIVQPGGSLKDSDVIAACDKAGITMLFTGQRCFKH